ncbi:MAG: hypothetical protein GF308_14145 [Candidatus Heimdallarchaeota archaeon]|nr:hypothetical protein [Candidatus Heimdallarchaeota archaeon]
MEGKAFLTSDQLGEARQCFKQIVELLPHHSEAQQLLDKTDKALALRKEQRLKALLEAGERYLEEGAITKAEEQLAAMRELDPAHSFLDSFEQALAAKKQKLVQQAEEERRVAAAAALRQEREETLRKLIKKVDRIAVDELAQLLQFQDSLEVKRWIIDLPDAVPLKIDKDDVIISQELRLDSSKTEQAIDELLQSFEEFERKGKGKR